MVVPASEIEFLTNIRKSVVETLRLQPILGNFGGIHRDILPMQIPGGNASDSFSLEEETLFGRCESHYTLTRLPSHLAQDEIKEIKKHLRVDEQTEGAKRARVNVPVPKLKEEYWRLVRSINLDKCHERVIVQVIYTINTNLFVYYLK